MGGSELKFVFHQIPDLMKALISFLTSWLPSSVWAVASVRKVSVRSPIRGSFTVQLVAQFFTDQGRSPVLSNMGFNFSLNFLVVFTWKFVPNNLVCSCHEQNHPRYHLNSWSGSIQIWQKMTLHFHFKTWYQKIILIGRINLQKQHALFLS